MRLRLALLWALGFGVMVAACGGGNDDDDDDSGGDGDADTDADADSDTDADADADADADGDGDGDGDADGDGDGDGDGDADGDGDVDCATAVDDLAGRLDFPNNLACTAVVRFDHDTMALLGYALVCGDYGTLTEEQARAVAQADTGFGQAGQRLSPDAPEDAWVFYESPGDFGGASAVSGHTGLSVFGGSIVWMGHGEITYPGHWDPAADLAFDCPPVGDLGTTRGYDLVGGGDLDDADVEEVVDNVMATAIPGAFWQGGYVFSTVVLRYPRSVGVFDPTTAEWIALVDGGWLE